MSRAEPAKVTGEATYVADLALPDMVHAAFVHAEAPHARLTHVDTTAARALPGVVAVLTGADIGERRFGRKVRDYPVLATDRVLFAGQRVAIVLAEDLATARAGARLVAVGYEPLPAVLGPEVALADGSPDLHPHREEYGATLSDDLARNVQATSRKVTGDADDALAQAERVVTRSYRWPRVHSAPMEPRGCLVHAHDGRVDLWSANKEPYKLRRQLAQVTGLPEADVVIHPTVVGGDFGGKGAPLLEAACYYASRQVGRPVRAVLDYREELATTASRHQGGVTISSGVTGGRLVATRARLLIDGGAFAAVKPSASVVQYLHKALGAYDVPHRDEYAVAAYTNGVPGGHVRTPGGFQAIFAGESHVDVIARELGRDPIGFRLANATDPSVVRVLHALRDVIDGWRAAGLAPDTGVGVALYNRAPGSGASRVRLTVEASGVLLEVGVPGQGGGSYAAFAALTAAALGIPVERVTVRQTATDQELVDDGAGASRTTAIGGGACLAAARQVLDRLGEPADGYWPAERLGGDSITIEATHEIGRADRGSGRASHIGVALEVAVDRATGKAVPTRAHLVVEAGRLLNPAGARGQLEGGFVFGLSQARYEHLRVRDGQVLSTSLGDYKLASALDVPPLGITLLEDTEPTPLATITAIGELANTPVAAALANAVHDAVGVRVDTLPINAEAVWRALHR